MRKFNVYVDETRRFAIYDVEAETMKGAVDKGLNLNVYDKGSVIHRSAVVWQTTDVTPSPDDDAEEEDED